METEAGARPLVRPDDLLYARLARLVLLLAEGPRQPNRKPWDVERMSTYDFFADNPLLLFDEDSAERRTLLLAGFDPRSLSYHSSSQRFTSRRARIQHDLAHLLAYGLVEVDTQSSRVVYALTPGGHKLAAQFTSSYSDGYRTSAGLVARALNRMSDSALRSRTSLLLEAQPFVIDLYSDAYEDAL